MFRYSITGFPLSKRVGTSSGVSGLMATARSSGAKGLKRAGIGAGVLGVGAMGGYLMARSNTMNNRMGMSNPTGIYGN